MSSLLQFGGQVSWRGVHLQCYQTKPRPEPRWADIPACGDAVELVPCAKCGESHARLHIFVRKPVGMLGCWVQFRYCGAIHAPDLSVPIALFTLPRDARPVTDEENARLWHT